jgi:diphthamide biosynthesis protein 2
LQKVNQKNYFKPIVTPYELYLALTAPVDGAPLWGTDWIADFERVMSLATDLEPPPEEQEDIPHFSLVTGKLVNSETSRPMRSGPKTAIEYDTNDSALVKTETQVALREDETVAVRGVRSLAGEKLVSRSWRGLDSLVAGDKEGAEVEIGLDGVARGYRSGSDGIR